MKSNQQALPRSASGQVGDKIVSLRTSEYESPLGRLLLVASEKGLRAVLWPADMDEHGEPGKRVKLASRAVGDSEILRQATTELAEYFRGERQTFEVALDPVGTDFQREVWHGLANIPFGQTTTYGRQAATLGRPKATRAVASANGKNPLSIVLPCHRIIGADGSLTGFAGGLDAKAWLLTHEGNQATW